MIRSSVLVVLVLLAAGCGSNAGSGATTQTPATAGSGGAVHVVMRNLFFNPDAVAAKVGQTVTWANEDSSPHNVMYVSGPRFTSSRPILNPGDRFSITPTEAGTIHYFCSLHPWMKATIVVNP